MSGFTDVMSSRNQTEGAMGFGHELGTLSTQSVIQGAIAAQGAGYVPTPQSHILTSSWVTESY